MLLRKHILYSIAILICLSFSALAQTKPSAASNKQVNSSDSLKKAMTDLKSLFGGKRDTITITVDDVDFDDSSLSNLKENLKILKGVKSLTMQYKSGNAMFAIAYKGNSNELWDNLSAPAKKPFKLQEENDKSISLKLRAAKP
jgi:predicted RND superfamily exporter protein